MTRRKRSGGNGRAVAWWIVLAVLAQGGRGLAGEEGPTPWPSLSSLDTLLAESMAILETGSVKTVQAGMNDVRLAAGRVAAEPAPAGAGDESLIRYMQQELQHLVHPLTNPYRLSRAELASKLDELHALVEYLMREAEVPHKHPEREPESSAEPPAKPAPKSKKQPNDG